MTETSKSQFFTNRSVKYLINKNICEYDIKRAGLTALFILGHISEDTYKLWLTKDKLKISKYIGVNMSKYMIECNDCINNAVNKFIQLNDIQNENILSKNRDALLLYNTKPKILDVDGFKFVAKNKYTSYFNIDNVILLYNSHTEKFDLKSIDSRFIKDHKLIPYIRKFIGLYENLDRGFVSYTDIYNHIFRFRNNYINMKLNIDCYREISYGNPFCYYDKVNNRLYYLSYYNENSNDELITRFNFMKYIVPFINILPTYVYRDLNKRKNKQKYGKN